MTVLITGASSGIGHATAEYFAEKGWNVAATMRSPEKETALTRFPNLKLYRLDVTDAAVIDSAIQAAIADFGSLDVVVNNAGYGVDGVFEAMNDDVIRRQFETNVFGLMRVTRAVIPYLRKQGKGVIIQVASMGGRLAFPLYSIYHGTKWAVEGFSESLHYELKPLGIQVRIIEPGAIKTEFTGRSREAIIPSQTAAYDEFIAKCDKVSIETGNTGEPPEKVARTIFKAATDKGGRLRYVVGYPATLLLPLRKFLPQSWFFGIIRGLYKI